MLIPARASSRLQERTAREAVTGCWCWKAKRSRAGRFRGVNQRHGPVREPRGGDPQGLGSDTANPVITPSVRLQIRLRWTIQWRVWLLKPYSATKPYEDITVVIPISYGFSPRVWLLGAHRHPPLKKTGHRLAARPFYDNRPATRMYPLFPVLPGERGDASRSEKRRSRRAGLILTLTAFSK